jgi:hypothetical protein
MNYSTMTQKDVPQGRNGKHREVIGKILSDLGQVPKGNALKIPLSALAQGKANVRAALNRASRKAGRNVATASDGDFLYVWNEE